VLHGPDLAEAILDRVLEQGRHLELRGPSNPGTTSNASTDGKITSKRLIVTFPQPIVGRMVHRRIMQRQGKFFYTRTVGGSASAPR
jgi:hypothetical protein